MVVGKAPLVAMWTLLKGRLLPSAKENGLLNSSRFLVNKGRNGQSLSIYKVACTYKTWRIGLALSNAINAILQM